ncbi:MAG: accessory gene regulator B family protein [Lachnospiraceae bacterium]|nr:accessory gene regulator B family protein [Lachnospiraceae bacterium]
MIKRILDWLYAQGYVNESNDKIIELGLQRMKSTFTSIIFSAIVSWLMGDVVIGLLFELTYIPIRIYAGGYHASSKRQCEYLSYGSLLLCMILIFYVPIKVEIMHLFLLLSSMVIFLFAPVESPNKRLNSMEKKVYRQKSIIYLVITVFVYVLMVRKDKMLYTRTVMYSICLVAVGLIQMETIKAKMKRIHM